MVVSGCGRGKIITILGPLIKTATHLRVSRETKGITNAIISKGTMIYKETVAII
jgi:hypothetical protein